MVNLQELPGIGLQFQIILQRMARHTIRSTTDLTMRFGVMIAMSLLNGWVFYNCENDQSGVNSRLAGLFMTVGLTGFCAALSVPGEIKARTYIFRERSSKMWSTLPFVFARSLTQFPLIIIQAILLGTPAYFLRGDAHEFERYAKYILTILVTMMGATAWMEVISGLAPTQEISAALNG